MTLETLLAPRSVAVIGASDNPDKIGGRPISYMREFGFEGAIYPVNPARETVQGLRCYPSITDLPEGPDAAIIAVGGEDVMQAVEDCAAIGTRAAIIMSSGFGETGEEGMVKEARLREVATASGMRLVGPNSQGLANFGTGAILSFSTMFVEVPPQDGAVACVSQSGAMSVVPYGLLRERGIGMRHIHSTGNDCDVTVSELAGIVVQDPDVRLLLLYIEHLSDPHVLARTAAIARDKGVPIIALKGGRSDDGRRAAASHTGAIATSDRVVDAFFEKLGIWRANGVPDLVRATELYLKDWRPRGRRVAVISNSGATCVLASDAAEREKLPLARLSDETRVNLKNALPAFASSSNPIDITAALLTNSGLFGQVLPAVGVDDGVDMAMVGIPVSGRGYDYPRFASDTAAFMSTVGKPIVVAAPQAKVRAAFQEAGVPIFASEDDAIAALAQFAGHHERLAEARPEYLLRRHDIGGDGRALDEDSSLRLLEEHGLQCVTRQVCTNVEEAIAFQGRTDRPIVLKACSADIPHKSEHGLVRLRLSGAEDIRLAWSQIEDNLHAQGRDGVPILAAEMISGMREIVVGGHFDPTFGPVIMVGDGGILVEAVPDNRLLLPPLCEGAVERALQDLRIAPLFDGVRGQPSLDRDAVAGAVRTVADLMSSGKVQSVDVNPLMASADRAVALDALVVTSERLAQQPAS